MGFLDDLVGKSNVGTEGTGGDPSALIQAVLGMLAGSGQGGGLQALIQAFQEKGLGDLMSSWVGTGKNLPVNEDQMKNGLGPDLLSQLASRAGMAPDAAASSLTGLLPDLIDKVTPGGKVPDFDRLQKDVDFLGKFLPKG